MRLKLPSTEAWLLLTLVLCIWLGLSAPALAADSAPGYTCTSNSSGAITCTADAPSGGDDGGGSGGGWLTNLTVWLKSVATSVVNAVRDIAKDVVVWLVRAVTDLFLLAIAAIGVPTFLANYGLGSLLSNVSPILGFFVVQFKIGAALSLIGAGYAFRLLRKLLTLGQW